MIVPATIFDREGRMALEGLHRITATPQYEHDRAAIEARLTPLANPRTVSRA
jgi:energy-converting hydrogenase Eha subunit F